MSLDLLLGSCLVFTRLKSHQIWWRWQHWASSRFRKTEHCWVDTVMLVYAPVWVILLELLAWPDTVKYTLVWIILLLLGWKDDILRSNYIALHLQFHKKCIFWYCYMILYIHLIVIMYMQQFVLKNKWFKLLFCICWICFRGTVAASITIWWTCQQNLYTESLWTVLSVKMSFIFPLAIHLWHK